MSNDVRTNGEYDLIRLPFEQWLDTVMEVNHSGTWKASHFCMVPSTQGGLIDIRAFCHTLWAKSPISKLQNDLDLSLWH